MRPGGQKRIAVAQSLKAEKCKASRWRKHWPKPARLFILAEDFPYAVLYEAKPDYAWILVVMHLKRRPGYWRERLG